MSRNGKIIYFKSNSRISKKSSNAGVYRTRCLIKTHWKKPCRINPQWKKEYTHRKKRKETNTGGAVSTGQGSPERGLRLVSVASHWGRGRQEGRTRRIGRCPWYISHCCHHEVDCCCRGGCQSASVARGWALWLARCLAAPLSAWWANAPQRKRARSASSEPH